ncbi:MAG: hypothetical protein WBC04_12040 [Candidatus Acidiferrales bacterium]
MVSYQSQSASPTRPQASFVLLAAGAMWGMALAYAFSIPLTAGQLAILAATGLALAVRGLIASSL